MATDALAALPWEAAMRKPLRHAIDVLTAAGLRVNRVHRGGKHMEVRLQDGGLIRLPYGNHPSRRFERGLRSHVRKLLRVDAP
jgi:hypothetical protein